MLLPVRPYLREEQHINFSEQPVSIDELVAHVLTTQTLSPILKQTASETIEHLLLTELPLEGCDITVVLQELNDSLGNFYRKNAHPGMFSFIASPGLPTDPIGHAFGAALNQNVTGYQSAPGATTIEKKIIQWLCQFSGFPEHSEGLLLSGGSWSNLTALAVAAHHCFTLNKIVLPSQLVVCVAETVHFSIARALKIVGLGQIELATIPLNHNYQMDTAELRNKLNSLHNQTDKKACCVVASAGTTAMGVIDPLSEIALICKEFGVWLHIDAAYGGAALLSDKLSSRLYGLAEADSITIDLHKWAYSAFDASALLYKHPQYAKQVFQFKAEYVQPNDSETPEQYAFFDLSPEVSRRNRAVSIYLAWRYYGTRRIGENIRYNADCAYYLAQLVDKADDMELIHWPQLSICCFRYAPAKLKQNIAKLDEINEQIRLMLISEGDFILSQTCIKKRRVLRVCICSHQTRSEHIERLVDSVRRIGQNLLQNNA